MRKDLEIVIVSPLQTGADKHCLQVNPVNRMDTDHSHETEELTFLYLYYPS